MAEKRRREALRAKAEKLAAIEPPKAQDDFEATWKAERDAWSAASLAGHEAPAGEVCNMLEGLTPSGRNRQGRKVSFVEQGRSLLRREGVSERDRTRLTNLDTP
jgi:hypothetical protein